MSVQVCVRCAGRWPVAGAPARWCPGCRGALMSPTRPGKVEPRAGRNFRWVARRPGGDPLPASPRVALDDRTPAYRETPRWGLTDHQLDDDDIQPTRAERLAELAPTLLGATIVLFGLAAVAELFRYGLLLYNRNSLVGPTVLAMSDALVFTMGVLAPLVAFAAAAASVAWLLGARQAACRRIGREDPRSAATVAFGCLVPVVNLVWAGVFLSELAAVEHRIATLVRLWWATWAVSGVMLVASLVWRSQDSLQARANGVLFAVLMNLVAAAVAVLTLMLTRRVDGLDLGGRPRSRTRWVVA